MAQGDQHRINAPERPTAAIEPIRNDTRIDASINQRLNEREWVRGNTSHYCCFFARNETEKVRHAYFTCIHDNAGHLVELKAGPHPQGPRSYGGGGPERDWQIEINVSIHLEMFIKRHFASGAGRRPHKNVVGHRTQEPHYDASPQMTGTWLPNWQLAHLTRNSSAGRPTQAQPTSRPVPTPEPSSWNWKFLVVIKAMTMWHRGAS